jgi:DHA3 family macrolide efflux protein-like MFS transporter
MNSKWRLLFFTVWAGQACSLVSSALVQFALIWWLTERTGSTTTLAAAAVASRMPTILLGPIAGPVVDRWSRRRVMIVSDALIALFTALLAGLFWLDVVQVWHVFAVLFVRSLGDAFQGPAMRASTSLMVPDEQLTRVAGMNAALQGVIGFVSPPMGALLLAALHVQGTLAIDIVTAALAIVPLLFVRLPRPGRAAVSDRRPSLGGEMAEGLRFLWDAKGLLLLFATAVAAMFFLAPPLSFVPLLVTRHFGGGALELGWMQSVHTIYQHAVPAGMQGRFFTLNRSALSVATPLSLAVGGPLADRLGVRTLFLAGGAATLAIALVRAFTPGIRALDDEPAAPPRKGRTPGMDT